MKSDRKINTRLLAEYAALKADPTLEQNHFLQGYVKILELLRGKSSDFVEGIAEGLDFVTDDDKN